MRDSRAGRRALPAMLRGTAWWWPSGSWGRTQSEGIGGPDMLRAPQVLRPLRFLYRWRTGVPGCWPPTGLYAAARMAAGELLGHARDRLRPEDDHLKSRSMAVSLTKALPSPASRRWQVEKALFAASVPTATGACFSQPAAVERNLEQRVAIEIRFVDDIGSAGGRSRGRRLFSIRWGGSRRPVPGPLRAVCRALDRRANVRQVGQSVPNRRIPPRDRPVDSRGDDRSPRPRRSADPRCRDLARPRGAQPGPLRRSGSLLESRRRASFELAPRPGSRSRSGRPRRSASQARHRSGSSR